jgi:hypothetical protein
MTTTVTIYRNKFGKHFTSRFTPTPTNRLVIQEAIKRGLCDVTDINEWDSARCSRYKQGKNWFEPLFKELSTGDYETIICEVECDGHYKHMAPLSACYAMDEGKYQCKRTVTRGSGYNAEQRNVYFYVTELKTTQ